MGAQHHHHVYVIDLEKSVLDDNRFSTANPQYVDGKPCVYVGMTGLTPDERFQKHKAGHKANSYVRLHGRFIRRRDCSGPMAYEEAVAEEVATADRLRTRGYAVWQN